VDTAAPPAAIASTALAIYLKIKMLADLVSGHLNVETHGECCRYNGYSSIFCQRLTTNFFMHRLVITLARKESAHRRETKIVRWQDRKISMKNKHMAINSHNNDNVNQAGSLRVRSETIR
jgi:hypothetical protein